MNSSVWCRAVYWLIEMSWKVSLTVSLDFLNAHVTLQQCLTQIMLAWVISLKNVRIEKRGLINSRFFDFFISLKRLSNRVQHFKMGSLLMQILNTFHPIRFPWIIILFHLCLFKILTLVDFIQAQVLSASFRLLWIQLISKTLS